MALASTADAHASLPPTSSLSFATPTPLRVSVDPAIADAALWPQWLSERNPTLADALSLPGHEQLVFVQLEGATYDYRVTITPMRDGKPLGSTASPVPCECNTESLLSLFDRELAKAVDLLQSTPVETVEPTPAATRPSALEPTSAPEPTPQPPANESAPRLWKISPLGVAGAATGAFGLLALGVGAALIVPEDRKIDGWSKFYRDLDPLGNATLSVGAVALAGGVAMVVIDGIRLRRRSPVARRTTLSPALDRRTAGATLTGRF